MAAAAAAKPALESLLCRTVGTLREALPPATRVLSLDVTRSHLSLAVSDKSQTTAAPFGVLSRISPIVDARLLRPACAPLSIAALVVGVSPGSQPDAALVRALVDEDALPDLAAVLFYSEAHVMARALRAQRDYVDAAALLPEKLETRKRGRFFEAMMPRVAPENFDTRFERRASLAASELLQTVLDDLTE